MPIDPEAIIRFREAYAHWNPDFKGMPEREVRSHIRSATGLDFGQEALPSRPYQLEGLGHALALRQSFLFLDMRMGKTKIALNWAQHLRRAGKVRRKGLIIAHAPIGLSVWLGETAKHTDLDLRAIESGEAADEQLCDALDSRADAIVMSWPTIQTLFTEKRRNRKNVNKLYPADDLLRMVALHFDHAVVDETHLCQDHGSLRFLCGAGLLEECGFRLGLTGTPMGRNPFSIWAQGFLIDRGETFGRSYYFFEQAFGRKEESRFARKQMKRKTRKGEEISVGYEWVFDDSLGAFFRRKLAAISLSYQLDEVQELNVLNGTIDLQMTEAQRSAYNDVVEKFVTLDSGDDIAIRATFVRMRQVASGFLPFNDGEGEQRVLEFPRAPKMEWLRAFMDELRDDVQGVIFHEFTRSGDAICRMLGSIGRSYAWIYGGKTEKANAEAVRDFQAGKAQLLVANATTGGTSIDLPMADWLCFYESPVSPTKRKQAAARPLARGSRPLLIDDLICAPVEQRILGFIEEGKEVLAQFVFQDRAKLRRALRA